MRTVLFIVVSVAALFGVRPAMAIEEPSYTVVRGANVWLLDEPFAPLDPPFRAEFRHLLHLIAERCAATIVLVTHDPVDAWALGRRVGVLGDGRLQCFGTPEELAARPGNRFVAFCLGRFCFVDGKSADGQFASDDGSVSASRSGSGAGLTLGVRPGDVRRGVPGEPAAVFRSWAVAAASPDGANWLLTLSRGRGRIHATWLGEPPAIGTTADWWCPAERCEWFDTETGNRLND